MGKSNDNQDLFILFDGRAHPGVEDPFEEACVLCAATSLREAKKDAKMFPESCIWELKDGKMEFVMVGSVAYDIPKRKKRRRKSRLDGRNKTQIPNHQPLAPSD